MIRIRTANIYATRDFATLNYEGCDILMINYHNDIVFASYYEIPQAIKIVRTMSYEAKNVITLCAKLRIEDDSFYSVAVFDKGIFLGISDALTEKDFTSGKCIKTYATSAGKFGVSVGTDFLCPQMENCVCAGADYIIEQSLGKFGCEYVCAVKGHSVFGTGYIALFEDTAVKSDGRTLCVPVGEDFDIQFGSSAVRPPLSFLKISRIE